MIITYHMPEERFPVIWEIPLCYFASKYRVKKAIFIPNHAIWGENGLCRFSLLSRPGDAISGFLTLERDISAFKMLEFELIGGTWLENQTLTLVKEPVREKTFSLPHCLFQLELE